MLQKRLIASTLALLGLALLLAACSGFPGGVTPSSVAPGSHILRTYNPPANGEQYAFISEASTGNIDTYAIGAKSGALKSLGLTVVTGVGAQPVTIDPTGKFAYIASSSSNDVYAFTIDASSGKLARVKGSPFAAGTGPAGATTDPKGKFLYVANTGSNNVYAYTIDSSNGALTKVKGSPFTVNGPAEWVAVDLKGKFAYVPYHNASGPGDVAAFTINARTGALTPVTGSPFAAGVNPSRMTIDPNNKFAYVTNLASDDISAYVIDGNSGALTPVRKSPFKTGTEPYAIAIDPTGKFLYECNAVSFTVSAYIIDAASGALTPVKGSPFASGITPESIALDSTGSFLYVANYGTYYFATGNIFAYTIDKSSGALKHVRGSPFAKGPHYLGVATCKRVGSTCPPPLPL